MIEHIAPLLGHRELDSTVLGEPRALEWSSFHPRIVNPAPGAADFVDDFESSEAIRHALSQLARYLGFGSDIGGGEFMRKPNRQECSKIARAGESSHLSYVPQSAVDGSKSLTTALPSCLVFLDRCNRDQNHLEGQVGMVQECWNANEFIEHLMYRTSMRGLASLLAWAQEVGLDCNRVDQEDPVFIQEAIEFPAHGSKRRGLNLNQLIGAANVYDEPIQGHFAAITALGIASL